MEPERDLTGPAEEIDGGDASDDSFVIVSDIISGNGSSEEHDLAERAPDHPDLVIRDRSAEDGVLIERSVETVTDHAVLEVGVVGDVTVEASGSAFDGEGLSCENAGAGSDVEGSALAGDVEELNSETMAAENELDEAVKVQEEHQPPQASATAEAVDVGEEVKSEAKIAADVDVVDENSNEIGSAVNVEEADNRSEAVGAEAKLPEVDVDVGEEMNSVTEVAEAVDQLPEAPVKETNHDEMMADVDVGEELNSPSKVGEADQQAERELAIEPQEQHLLLPETSVEEINVQDLAADVDVGEELNSVSKVAEVDQQVECELALEPGEQEQHELPETSFKEINAQELAADVDVGEDVNSMTKVAETDQQAECELAVEREEQEQHQHPETSVKEIDVQELAADVDVGEELNSMTKVSESDRQPECELAVERDEEEQHQLPETSVKEINAQELAAEVDVGEELNSMTKVAEADQQAECELAVEREEQEQHQLPETSVKEIDVQELAADVDVGEELNSMSKVAESDQQPECELAVERDEEEQHQLPETLVKEISLQELAADVDVGEELNSMTKVAEADQQAECELAIEREEQEQHQLLETSVKEISLQELAADVDDGEELHTVTKVSEADQQAEFETGVELEEKQIPEVAIKEIKLQKLVTDVDVGEELNSETIPEAKQFVEVATLDERHQLPENAVMEAILKEVAEAVNVAEESNAEAKGADVDQQSLESAVKLEEDQLPEVAVTKAQLEELAATVNVLEKLDFEIKVAEADQSAEIESAVQVEENHEAKSVVTEANVQKESELVEDKDPEIVAESISQPEPEAALEEPEAALEVQEMQNADTVVAFTGQEMVPQPSVEAEIFVTVTDNLADPEFSLQEEHQPSTEVVETDVHAKSQSVMLAEKQQEADTAVTNNEPDERAEPECADVEETEEPRKIEASMIADQVEETPEPETLTGESSGQLVVVLETKPQSINDFPENGTGDAIISALKSSATPMLSQVLDKEIVIEAVTKDDSKHRGDVCETNADSEMELEHGVHETECMTSYIEGDQLMHNDDGEKSILEEVEGFDSMQAPLDEPALDGPGKNAVKKQYFCYLIRIPRPTDDDLRAKLQQSRLQLDEKTKIRDSVRVELQKRKATLNDYREKLEAARVVLRAARAAVAAKHQEIDSVQSMINKMRQASSIDEINEKIHYMDQTLQHESISLTQEKKYIRDIKNLKQLREQISATMGTQAEIQEVLDRRDEIEDEHKTLKKEMDSLRTTVMHADRDVKAALKRCDDETILRKNLQDQYNLVDNDRQEAYSHMHNLRIQSNDKIKNFNQYKDDQRTAMNYVNARDKEGIRTHCSKQVEIVMELWNRDDEFRKQYVKSNEYSTLRRLRTLDGRSLGPDEEPPVLPNFDNRIPSKLPSNLPNDNMSFPPLAVEARKEVSVAGTVAEQKVQTNNSQKQKNPATSTGVVKVMATVSNTELVEKASEKETTSSRTKEEEDLARKVEELARKEDELRKERAAAELKEQHRMEQKAKAKEAEERKKKKAEKDKAKAEHRAKKEAELKEKRRAKKEKKTTPTNSTNGAGGDDALIVDATPLETTREPEAVVGAAPRRSSRPSAILKQHNKIQPLPLPLRKGKRKIQTWMWVLVSALIVLVLFLAGNYASFSGLSMASFGFKG